MARQLTTPLRFGGTGAPRLRSWLAAFPRLALLLFVLHMSGAAHLLADVLLDDDMTCVDELAHEAHPGSPAPRCPTAQGFGHGQRFAPAAGEVLLPPPDCVEVADACADDARPPFVVPRSIDRPPRA